MMSAKEINKWDQKQKVTSIKSHVHHKAHAHDVLHTSDVLRQDDIEAITSEETGVDKDTVKTVFNTFWDTICKALEHGKTVKLHGKGRFYLSKRSARMGRNPLTGEEYRVPEREAMAFQTSPAYAKRLRERRKKLAAQEHKPE